MAAPARHSTAPLFFKLYALDTVLTGLSHPNKAAVEAAMRDHVLAQSVLIGAYEKGR